MIGLTDAQKKHLKANNEKALLAKLQKDPEPKKFITGILTHLHHHANDKHAKYITSQLQKFLLVDQAQIELKTVSPTQSYEDQLFANSKIEDNPLLKSHRFYSDCLVDGNKNDFFKKIRDEYQSLLSTYGDDKEKTLAHMQKNIILPLRKDFPDKILEIQNFHKAIIYTANKPSSISSLDNFKLNIETNKNIFNPYKGGVLSFLKKVAQSILPASLFKNKGQDLVKMAGDLQPNKAKP